MPGHWQWRQDRRKPPAHERLGLVVQDLPAPGEARQAGHLGLRTTSPSCMLNGTAPETAVPVPDMESPTREEIEAWSYEQITERQLEQVKAIRADECNLRREYPNTAFTDLILDLQEELNDLQQAQFSGEVNTEPSCIPTGVSITPEGQGVR